MVPFGCVLLVDGRGWVLLQERDEHAPIAPEHWGLPGGHLEDGEDFLTGALRELEEETGVRLEASEVHEVGRYDVHPELPGGGVLGLYAARTDLTDADIVVGEGRQIVFVDPAALPRLTLTDSASRTLPGFLASDLYQELIR